MPELGVCRVERTQSVDQVGLYGGWFLGFAKRAFLPARECHEARCMAAKGQLGKDT